MLGKTSYLVIGRTRRGTTVFMSANMPSMEAAKGIIDAKELSGAYSKVTFQVIEEVSRHRVIPEKEWRAAE